MKYKVIFTSGYIDDSESLMKGYKSDVLLFDEDDYYEINFTTVDVIKNRFGKDDDCYLESNLVLLHSVTKDNILKSIPFLHKWLFRKRWRLLTEEQVEKYYYPKKDWMIYSVDVS